MDIMRKLRLLGRKPAKKGKRWRNIAIGTAGLIGAAALAKKLGAFGRKAATPARPAKPAIAATPAGPAENPYTEDLFDYLQPFVRKSRAYEAGLERHRRFASRGELDAFMAKHNLGDKVSAMPVFDDNMRGFTDKHGGRMLVSREEEPLYQEAYNEAARRLGLTDEGGKPLTFTTSRRRDRYDNPSLRLSDAIDRQSKKWAGEEWEK